MLQSWDGIKPAIQFLLRDYRTWLVAEKANDKLEEKKFCKHSNFKSFVYNKTDAIPCQTPISAIWRILVPYLFSVRKLPDSEAVSILQIWLDSCSTVRPLEFNSRYLIRQNIRNRRRNCYLPIRIHKLSSENKVLYDIITCSN